MGLEQTLDRKVQLIASHARWRIEHPLNRQRVSDAVVLVTGASFNR
jgi:hypothetical protein